jgi:23S rRNA pseudouridine1911/1915/1917 synthase
MSKGCEKNMHSNVRKWLTYIVPSEMAGKTVQEILTGPMAISRRMIQKLTRTKGILYNDKPTFLKRPVKEGHVIKVAAAVEEGAGLTARPVPFGLVFEDEELLIVDKPAGINVHPVRPGQGDTLAAGIAYHWQQQGEKAKVRFVHRLDRDTSGLLVVAKSMYAHQHLDRQLRERTLKREYLALVEGRMAKLSGTLNYPIGRAENHAIKRVVRPDGEPAVTHYLVRETFADASLVELTLDTGRTHQIRVHLAHAGHPVIGDRLYGSPSPLIQRQALHAFRLTLLHPVTNERLSFTADLPEDMRQAAEQLRAHR